MVRGLVPGGVFGDLGVVLQCCMEKKSLVFGQIFGIRFFLGRVSGDFWGFWGVIFGGFLEAF